MKQAMTDAMIHAHKAGRNYAKREYATWSDAHIIADGLEPHEREAFLAGYIQESKRIGILCVPNKK